MRVKYGRFCDDWRGNGVFISAGNWLVALRRRCRLRFVRPPGKPGYSRLYFGPVEIEHRKPTPTTPTGDVE